VKGIPLYGDLCRKERQQLAHTHRAVYIAPSVSWCQAHIPQLMWLFFFPDFTVVTADMPILREKTMPVKNPHLMASLALSLIFDIPLFSGNHCFEMFLKILACNHASWQIYFKAVSLKLQGAKYAFGIRTHQVFYISFRGPIVVLKIFCSTQLFLLKMNKTNNK
jgi:hypothetical protein